MQEEVENRTLTLVVSGTKFTGRLMKAAISALDKTQQAKIIEQSKHVKSRSEMKSFVSGLSANG